MVQRLRFAGSLCAMLRQMRRQMVVAGAALAMALCSCDLRPKYKDNSKTMFSKTIARQRDNKTTRQQQVHSAMRQQRVSSRSATSQRRVSGESAASQRRHSSDTVATRQRHSSDTAATQQRHNSDTATTQQRHNSCSVVKVSSEMQSIDRERSSD